MPSIRLCEVRFYRLPMRTRFPFRYGIASMTETPHLFVLASVEVDRRVEHGVSADGLPPKWFTKNPDTTFERDDLPSMLGVIRHAADVGVQLGVRTSFFAWWHELYVAQQSWADENDIAPLLAGLGVSLIERAVLDAVCRGLKSTVFQVLQRNALQVDFGSLRPGLSALTPADVLREAPMPRVGLRHTVGLGDAIASSKLSGDSGPDDGLPFTLEENIRAYGLRYFKIKLCGDSAVDRQRLLEIASVIERTTDEYVRFTLDGNENYETVAQFREAWTDLLQDQTIRAFAGRCLLFVEQPVHRANALCETIAEQLAAWSDAPPIVIDESDADLTSLPIALSLGYSGTSYKNCKGIMKGLLNLATIVAANRQGHNYILSAEDLGNVGPVALLQDLAMVAALGIDHVERNGHHYFAGLSMFSQEVQSTMLSHHGDLYHQRDTFVALAPQRGELSLRSVNEAPFGLEPTLDLEQFDPWMF